MAYRDQDGMPRGRLIFICTWLGIFAVSYILWALFLGGVNKELVRYEEYQPRYAAEEVFREYFADPVAEELIGYAELDLSKYDTADAALKHLQELVSGGDLSYREKSVSDEAVSYEVLASGVVFAEFDVVPDVETEELFGEHGYKLGRISVRLMPGFSGVIVAPKNAVVYVNGRQIGEEHRVGDYRQLADAVYFPDDDPDARFMAEYHIDGLFAAPAVTVMSSDLKIVYGVEYNKTSGVFDTEYSYRTILSEIFEGTYVAPETPIEPPKNDTGEEEIDKAYADFLYEAISLYEKYRHLPKSESEKVSWRILAYFKPGTETYSSVMGYYYDSNFLPDNYEFSNVKITEFVWTDDTHTAFSCVFAMDSLMWKSGNDAMVTEKLSYTLNVDVSGEKYLISSLKKNN